MKSILVTIFCVANVMHAHAGVYGCDASYLKSAYSKKHLETASNYAIYGLLSNNTYAGAGGTPLFKLPDYWKKIRTVEHDSGLYFDLYEKRDDGTVPEVVIAFRGTVGKLDWLNGNLSSAEYEAARKYIKDIVDAYKGARIVATGHSLGGGLAMFASYQFDGITAVGFNASPRYYDTLNKRKNTRVIIFEKGDATRIVGNLFFPWRWGGLAKEMHIYFQKYDFINGTPMRNHFIYPLARGVLMVGSLVNPELAGILSNNCNLPIPR